MIDVCVCCRRSVGEEHHGLTALVVRGTKAQRYVMMEYSSAVFSSHWGETSLRRNTYSD